MFKTMMAESGFPDVSGPTVITKKIGSREYFFIVRTYQGKEEYLSIGMNRQPKWVTNFNFASTYPDAGAAQDAYDMLMKNYRESADYRYWNDVFEKKIPQCMRYKEFSIEGDILYWITQGEFDEFDLSHFIDALEDSPLKKAFVILRDDSTYSFRKDLRNGKGTMVDLTQNNYIIRNYRESAGTSGSIEIKEDLMIPGTRIMLEAGDRIRQVTEHVASDLVPAELKPYPDVPVLVYCGYGQNVSKVVLYPSHGKFRICSYDKFNPKMLNAGDTVINERDIDGALETMQNFCGGVTRVEPLKW